MAKKKKSGADSIVGGVIVVVLFGLFSLPTPVLIVLGFAAVVAGFVYLQSKWKKPSDTQAVPRTPAPSTPTKSQHKSVMTTPKPHQSEDASVEISIGVVNLEPTKSRYVAELPMPKARQSTSTTTEVPVSVQRAAQQTTAAYQIPKAPPGYGEAKFIPLGESITVAGISLPGGLIYVGTRLVAGNRQNDPCLIDPSKPVSQRGNYAERQMGYWPDYGTISPEARRSYLNWLAGGRKDSDADIGFVFLFFYGLERRVLVDSIKDPSLRAEWPAIRKELERLIGIYGAQSASFARYASTLLMWLSQGELEQKPYLTPLPKFERAGELPFALRFALGHAALNKVPVPAKLALAWIRLDPMSALRTAAYRCAEEFDRLFEIEYEKAFGQGIVIAKNRTKLKLTYAPASSGFGGQIQVADIGEVPDVSVLTAPLNKLNNLVEVVTKELDSYSRFVGKNPDSRNALEGLLLLPVSLWPASVHSTLNALRERIGNEWVVMTFQALQDAIGAKGALNKENSLALAQALESLQIGIEPDILAGAKIPKADESVVLFAVSAEDVSVRATPTYKAALLTLQLASTVANADGDFCTQELEHLHRQVQSWTHLTPNHILRLQAHLRLLQITPASLAALRSKLDGVDANTKNAIASFMATVAQADGTVSPEEVKVLEKLYKALGVDAKRVFTDVHVAAAGGVPVGVSAEKSQRTGFKLDVARIAALQKDTEAVTVLLSGIFNEEETSHETAEVPSEDVPVKENLLGLDEPHTVLARLLMSRSEWARDELGDAAADLELMLDGALETINEAAFDAHDVPFIEGDDPISVNPELLEKLAA